MTKYKWLIKPGDPQASKKFIPAIKSIHQRLRNKNASAEQKKAILSEWCSLASHVKKHGLDFRDLQIAAGIEKYSRTVKKDATLDEIKARVLELRDQGHNVTARKMVDAGGEKASLYRHATKVLEVPWAEILVQTGIDPQAKRRERRTNNSEPESESDVRNDLEKRIKKDFPHLLETDAEQKIRNRFNELKLRNRELLKETKKLNFNNPLDRIELSKINTKLVSMRDEQQGLREDFELLKEYQRHLRNNK